MPALYNTGIC